MLRKDFQKVLQAGIVIGFLVGTIHTILIIWAISVNSIDFGSCWEWYLLLGMVILSIVIYMVSKVNDFIDETTRKEAAIDSVISSRLRKPVEFDIR